MMAIATRWSLALLAMSLAATCQLAPVTEVVHVQAVLVDGQLNQKPVPRLALTLHPAAGTPIEARTDFQGSATISLPSGRYTLDTPDGIHFDGTLYRWHLTITVGNTPMSVSLSNDNATTTAALAPAPAPVATATDLASQFRRLRNSVVTVWSDSGHGSGFFADPRGLILTNDHVVAGSTHVAVQFDPRTKLEAVVLAEDHDRDVAVLQANFASFPGAIIASLATSPELAKVSEGDSVFSIGSPLNQEKILTTGVVSKVDAQAFISDININHGNSGGPLFDAGGDVIGITTFIDAGQPNGPGVSGIIKISQAMPVLQRAEANARPVSDLSTELLPTPPATVFPVDALKAVEARKKFDTKPYFFSFGGYDAVLATPPLTYWLSSRDAAGVAAARAHRTKGAIEAVFDPGNDLRNEDQYVGQYAAVVMVLVAPEMKPTFLSSFANALAAASSHGLSGVALNMRFKADFSRMELDCGDHPVEPIFPGKIPDVARYTTAGAYANDVAFEGYYEYPPSAFDPACGKMSLTVYSPDPKKKPVTKTLDPKLVQHIWDDFAPWRAAAIAGGN